MERLRLRDLQAASRLLEGLYAFRDLDGFVADTLAMLPRIVSSEVTVYAELNFPRQRYRMVDSPADTSTKHLNAFRTYFHEHPFAQHRLGGRNGRATKVSDFLTMRQFRRLGIYNEGFKQFGMDSEMVVWLAGPSPLDINFALHRTRSDFSERDRLLLDLLRPHLIQSYRNAEAVSILKRSGDAKDSSLVLLERPDIVRRSDPPARRLLEVYFGRAADGGLPESLRRWVRNHDRLMSATDQVPPAREPLVVERFGTRLVVRLLSGPNQHLLLLKEERQHPNFDIFRSLGLTPRQADILGWVAKGKTNGEIAIILGISARTVAKHLEMTYPKLGVENRTAAAARALSVLHDGPEPRP
jgi:DNA-binding CsgD family transcriptional regulator